MTSSRNWGQSTESLLEQKEVFLLFHFLWTAFSLFMAARHRVLKMSVFSRETEKFCTVSWIHQMCMNWTNFLNYCELSNTQSRSGEAVARISIYSLLVRYYPTSGFESNFGTCQIHIAWFSFFSKVHEFQ